MDNLQKIIFNKAYPQYSQKAGRLYPIIKDQSEDPDKQINQISFAIAANKFKVYQAVGGPAYSNVISQASTSVKEFERKYRRIPEMIRNLYVFAQRWFLFEVMPEGQHEIQQKELLKALLNLASPKQYSRNDLIMKKIEASLYLSVTFLQLQARRLISVKKSERGEQLSILFDFLVKTIERFPETRKLCRKICLILTHCSIHYFNSIISIENIKGVENFLYILISYYICDQKFLNNDSAVVLLYNCVKILLGFDRIPDKIVEPIKKIFKYYNMQYCKSYGQNLLQMFFIIKIIIFRKPQSKRISKSYGKHSKKNNGSGMIRADSEPDAEISSDQLDSSQIPQTFQQKFLFQRLSIFLNVNLDVIVVQLNEIAQNIIRHRVASLATLICFKLGIKKFSKYFIELMHDSPFNNDIQTIKLCFQLFSAQEFTKLQHLFQVVLSAPSCKNLKERQVLLAMCVIFTGLYLQNREEALLYAKLNHQQSKKSILTEETLLSHVGFAYYNMANHEKYLTSKQVFLTQALNFFKKAYELNSNNYLLTYCMGKICLSLYQYDEAYQYSVECCKSGRGLWMPFTILACVYMCQRRITKASIIIDQLLKKYDDIAILHYVRAYVEVNKILIDVEADQQLQASKILGMEYNQICRQKIMKSKSIQIVLKQCQFYHQLSVNSIKTQFQENYLLNNLNQFSSEQEKKIVFEIIGLLFELDQLNLVENIIKNIPNVPITSFYKAQLHEHRKQIPQAIHQYNQMLMQNPYHVQTLTNLAILQIQNQNIEKASHYIDLAAKFSDNGGFTLAKGVLLGKLGKIKEAHLEFLKQRDIAWCQSLPALIFYY